MTESNYDSLKRPSFPRGLSLILLVVALVRVLFVELPLFLLAQLFVSSRRDVSLRDRIYLFQIRRLNNHLPIKALRWLTNIGQPHEVLESARYKPYRQNLYHFVRESDFCGYWVVQSSFERPAPPRTSDIVILYLHGGGYFSSHPDCYLLFMLRLAEAILCTGKTVSIFALDYTLAPEAVFPTQLRQATAGYRWLVEDINIASERVLVAGDSAGGHLTVSLMRNIWQPLAEHRSADPNAKFKLPKPGLGIALISPWLSLADMPDSFKRNVVTDVLDGPWLHKVGLRFVGAKSMTEISPESLDYIEFVKGLEVPIDWDAILPAWMWASAGCNEIMYDTVAAWVKAREKDCNGRVEYELDRKEPHVYAWLKTLDVSARKRFLKQTYQPGVLPADPAFEDTDRIGRIILARYAEVHKNE